MTESPNNTVKTTQSPPGSTLIEFPGANRNRPAWRKELTEKVREIQQRRAREAELEAELGPIKTEKPPAAAKAADVQTEKVLEAAKQLGLVPSPPAPEAPALNPLVAAALRRIERARTQTPAAPRPAHGRAQAATARVVEEHYEPEEESARAQAETARKPAPVSAAAREEAGRAAEAEKPSAAAQSNLLVVAAPKPQAKPQTPDAVAPVRGGTKISAGVSDESAAGVEVPEDDAVHARTAAPATTALGPKFDEPAAQAVAATSAGNVATAAAESRPQPRKVGGVIDDNWLERRGVDLLPKVVPAEAAAYDDRAPLGRRVGAALFDLVTVAFLCAPFAALIELTIGEWRDPRVFGSMGGIVAVVMFLYHTCAVALAGRTLGMRLFSLHAVDADTASVPTTWQCARRALVYMFSLGAFGLGVLYALFDAEGRTAHDLLSRTAVVRE